MESPAPDRSPIVYLAGPMTQLSPDETWPEVVRAANELIDLGALVHCPHFYAPLAVGKPRSAEFWRRYGCRWTRAADALYHVMPDAPSVGAWLERAGARSAGLPVLETMTEAALWVAGWGHDAV